MRRRNRILMLALVAVFLRLSDQPAAAPFAVVCEDVCAGGATCNAQCWMTQFEFDNDTRRRPAKARGTLIAVGMTSAIRTPKDATCVPVIVATCRGARLNAGPTANVITARYATRHTNACSSHRLTPAVANIRRAVANATATRIAVEQMCATACRGAISGAESHKPHIARVPRRALRAMTATT